MLDEYLNDDLPVCMEADSGCWAANFLYRAAWTGRTRSIIISNEERPDEDDKTDNDLPTPKRTNFKEAVHSLDDVHHFLESRGYNYRRRFKNWFSSKHSNIYKNEQRSKDATAKNLIQVE